MAAVKKAATKAAPKKASSAAGARPPTGWIDEPAPAPAPQWAASPPPYAPPAPRPFDERQYGLFLHLSALATIIGIPGFIGPLVMWLIKKDESPFIDRHGRAAMDFHLSLYIYAAVAVVIFIFITIATLGIGALLLIPVIFLLALAVLVVIIVFPILAGMKASRGEEATYPLSLRLLRRVEDVMR